MKGLLAPRPRFRGGASRGSRTAEMVCAARAVAHGATPVARFEDPTALSLLPADARADVVRVRTGERPRNPLERAQWAQLRQRSRMMVARTVAIDDAVREAGSPQVVILGAGLDGRAWRMAELRDAVVFEVDHPDSQRDKRERATRLTQTAREVRFVALDFASGELDASLASAEHDVARPTTWIWEGVVMYLERADIEATLAVVARRSAPGSRLIVAYHTRTLLLISIGWMLRLVGEPLRSMFTPQSMKALLAAHGFAVMRDQDVPEIAAALSPELGRQARSLGHSRIATAAVF